MSGYLADVSALARKDLLLELRARDTLPAMLLFVTSALVIFHFALPSGAGKLAGLGLLALTVAKVFVVDLAKLESIWRVASFLALGLLLLAGAFAYQRIRTEEQT